MENTPVRDFPINVDHPRPDAELRLRCESGGVGKMNGRPGNLEVRRVWNMEDFLRRGPILTNGEVCATRE
jgi:hypothetical protein